jgi:hypothetical protein
MTKQKSGETGIDIINRIDCLLDRSDEQATRKLIDMAKSDPNFLLTYIEIKSLDITKATLKMKMASLFLARALSLNAEKK